jgi:hypothetical protein
MACLRICSDFAMRKYAMKTPFKKKGIRLGFHGHVIMAFLDKSVGSAQLPKPFFYIVGFPNYD